MGSLVRAGFENSPCALFLFEPWGLGAAGLEPGAGVEVPAHDAHPAESESQWFTMESVPLTPKQASGELQTVEWLLHANFGTWL